ncbi:MAG: hypothetical protein CL823_01565 [Crocinitomicaceae bacterium]|nr:hypothetical protein [Crocinitomicaceae bacterium]
MKILQICPKPPRPQVDGGCIAMDAMSSGLEKNGHDVRIIAMCTEKHPAPKNSADKYKHIRISTALNPFSALNHLILNKSYNLARFFNEDVEREITNELRSCEYDLVILESLYATPYLGAIRCTSKAKVVLRSHNLEHEIWNGLSAKNWGLKKWYLRVLAKQLETAEREVVTGVDAVISITVEDGSWFKEAGARKVHVMPFGLDFNKLKSVGEVDHVFHFGSMDWAPNVEGVRWLLKEVWPKVLEMKADAQLVLAGRNMPEEFKTNSERNIAVIGEVESAEEFFKRNGVALVPILSGSGMRIKAVEALGRGLPIIGTSLGLCGLGLKDGVNAQIADSAEGFAQKILLYLNSNELAVKQASLGAKHIRSIFDNNIIIKELELFLNNYIAS